MTIGGKNDRRAGNSLLLVNKFPAQFMQGISRQVIDAANLPGVASRGGGQIQEDSLLNSLLAGNWFRWEVSQCRVHRRERRQPDAYRMR